MKEEEFKKYVEKTDNNIKKILENEELDFYQNLVRAFNRICDKEEKIEQALDEIEKYIEEYQEERTYTDRGGFTCVDGHFLRDSDDLLEIIKKAKGDVKNEN